MVKVKVMLVMLLLIFSTVACNNATIPDGNQVTENDTNNNETKTEDQDKNTEDTTEENKDSKDDATQTKDDGSKVVPAPDFTAVDLEGNEVKLSDYKGKFVFLNFWATWCTYCKQEMPAIQKMFEEYEVDKDQVAFLIVNVGESKEVIQNYLDSSETKYTFKILMDEDKSIASTYTVNAFPTSFFIDKESNVLGYVPGAIKEEDMKKYMEYMLSSEKTEE